MGSDLYARILDVATDDLDREGVVHEVVDHWNRNPVDDAVPLRLLGGVHHIVLNGGAPDLARHYPSTGGQPKWPDCGDAFLDTVAGHVADLRTAMLRPPQTNEVGRSGVLIGGLLVAAQIIDMPLELLEYGASAGLNLRLDAYRYDFGRAGWGDATSPVVIHTTWRGAPPNVDRPLHIEARRGCDTSPVDIGNPDDVNRLLSYVWPDQTQRIDRARRAVEFARRNPVTVDVADADVWLDDQLRDRRPGHLTVVIHSAVRQYLGRELRSRVDAIIRSRGEEATRHAPLAELSLEPGRKHFVLRLRLWPRGLDLLAAEAHPHGAWAEWFIGAGVR